MEYRIKPNWRVTESKNILKLNFSEGLATVFYNQIATHSYPFAMGTAY